MLMPSPSSRLSSSISLRSPLEVFHDDVLDSARRRVGLQQLRHGAASGAANAHLGQQVDGEAPQLVVGGRRLRASDLLQRGERFTFSCAASRRSSRRRRRRCLAGCRRGGCSGRGSPGNAVDRQDHRASGALGADSRDRPKEVPELALLVAGEAVEARDRVVSCGDVRIRKSSAAPPRATRASARRSAGALPRSRCRPRRRRCRRRDRPR